MKITKLISVYEKLIPKYKQMYRDYDKYEQLNVWFCGGLCLSSIIECGIKLGYVFREDGYYGKIIDNETGYLFPPNFMGKRYIKNRLNFMESEIIDLKRLMKKGYTHV